MSNNDFTRVALLPVHVHILRHACGYGNASGATPGYRDHYNAATNTPQYWMCEHLVSEGLMEKGDTGDTMTTFRVTDDGKSWLSLSS